MTLAEHQLCRVVITTTFVAILLVSLISKESLSKPVSLQIESSFLVFPNDLVLLFLTPNCFSICSHLELALHTVYVCVFVKLQRCFS
uniref:Putative udp-galactose transporter n=1 Tax=Ixodes scapularis TaxID=6945 RepID=A0A4D5RXD9_IXOSC